MAYDVFRSADFVARAVTGFNSTICVVTFDSYSDVRTLERTGFGEHFFEQSRIDAIHVIARSNEWYQNDEILEVCGAIAAITQNYERVYTYGSSMGGYAAIRFGTHVGARTAIALSPQFSVDNAVVPFEHRWMGDATRIDFVVERKGAASFVPLAYVSYDPFDLDRRHIDLFRERTELVELVIPHGGHPVTGFMAETGILGDFVLRIVNEQFDLSAFKSRAHAARKRSAQFWSVLSERARNPKVKTALAKRALSISPDDVVYQFKYARILAKYGNFEESEAIFNEAVRNHPTNPVLLHNLSEMHEWRGDFKEALSVMRRLVEAHPEAHIYDHRVAYLTNRFRVSTVMDNVGLIARRGFGRPINALVRRLRGGVDALMKRPERGGIQGAQPVETLVTTTPSPPPFVHSWLRHLDILRSAPQERIDIMLVGDSHVEYWPSHMWGSLTTYNFGVAADKTQHLLWRLAALPDASIRTGDVVLLAGTNNLGADDTAIGIAAGLGEVAKEVSRVAPDARLHILAVPPCGEGLEFRDHVRRQANALLHGRYRSSLVEADQRLRVEQDGRRLCYQEDNIHFSSHGYDVLTDLLLTRIRDERHRDARNSPNATK